MPRYKMPKYAYKLEDVRNGSKETLEEYVLSFVPKIEYIIRGLELGEKYYNDLMQAGLLGVVEAVRLYDKESDEEFGCYLKTRIMFKIKEVLRTIPAFSGFAFRKLDFNELQKLFDEKFILKDKEDDSEKLILDRRTADFFYCEVDSYQDSASYQDVECTVVEKISFETIISYLPLLTEIEQLCIIHYFGLFGNISLNYNQIGLMLGMTGEGVRLTLKRAYKKLRKAYETPTILKQNYHKLNLTK